MSTSPGAERARSEPAASAHPDAGRALVMLASPGLLLGLQLMPVVGILGVLALYWSRGWRDGLFALGTLLLAGAAAAFQALRGRLVARVELQLMLRGLHASRARVRARRDVARLLRLARDDGPRRDWA